MKVSLEKRIFSFQKVPLPGSNLDFDITSELAMGIFLSLEKKKTELRNSLPLRGVGRDWTDCNLIGDIRYHTLTVCTQILFQCQ